jgi:hypothetical protein
MSTAVSTVTSLYESAGAVLLVAEDALNLTDAGAPERSYVAPSEPAFDCCPFLTVHVPALSEEFTSAGPGGAATGHRTLAGSIILATYVVIAVRCAPEWTAGKPPLIEAIEASASEVLQDGWALWNELRAAIREGRIFGECSEVHFDGGASIVEQGGCVGWRFTIRASISGIPLEDGS